VGNKPAFGKMGKNAEPLLANDCSMCKQSTWNNVSTGNKWRIEQTFVNVSIFELSKSMPWLYLEAREGMLFRICICSYSYADTSILSITFYVDMKSLSILRMYQDKNICRLEKSYTMEPLQIVLSVATAQCM
jgi:hypothetical protein